MISPRKWQAEFLRALARHEDPNFLLVACPAAGKTIAGAAGVAQSMKRLDADQLFVVAPTLVVRDQWLETLRSHGYTMLSGCPLEGIPPHAHGAVLTYAELVWRESIVADACRNRRTIAIMDEVHHAGENLVWGRTLEGALDGAQLRLMLSGTPFRSDRDAIPWVRYGSDGVCRADFVYEYKRAVKEGVCRRIAFRAHDGSITWRNPDGTAQEATFNDRVDVPVARRRLRASLDASQPFLQNLLQSAHADLIAQREHSPAAAGLVICETQEHAMEVDRLLGRICGEMPTLAISDQPKAHALIRNFADGESMWLVSVRMVTEGVDIPRLSVIALCSGSTELMIKQVAGRALRSRATEAAGPALVHLPADPQLLHYARNLDSVAGVSSRVREDHFQKKTGGATPSGSDRAGSRLGRRCESIRAVPDGLPELVVPPQPQRRAAVARAGKPLAIAPPILPPSPEQIAAEAERLEAMRGDVLHLLGVWTQLRRAEDSQFHIATAHAELAAAVGTVNSSSPPERVEAALNWLQEQLRLFAATDPKAVLRLARTQRRLQLAYA